MSVKDLVNTWNLPSVSNDRIQVTLRIQFNDYARLHALKAAYPRRSVNDILSDIIKVGLDEVIEALPTYVVTEREFQECPGPEEVGDEYGPSVDFQSAYRRILEDKAKEEEKQKETAA